VSVKLLGIDPGFANLGLFGAHLFVLGAKPAFCKLILTKKDKGKRHLRQYDDDTRRLEQIEQEFEATLDEFAPDIVSSERFPSLRSNQATRQLALAFAAMHALTRRRKIPFLIHEPEDLKWEMCKSRTASKEDMATAVKRLFPGFKGWPPSKKVEHVIDAAAACLRARHDPIVEVLLRARAEMPGQPIAQTSDE
jgi:Holliday junction resolvasome RuvABC endonuclease subunit